MDLYSQIENILLFQGKFNISLELDRIQKVLNYLDNPQDKLKIIHIAGTNGKGSTNAIISEILTTQGYKVGSFTSPHLIKYNERIKINDASIPDKKFFELIEKIINISEKCNVKLTEFEILTAVMYEYFYEKNVDYVIVEVGLGGRFDATNCIKSPLISVITSISFDHTERLGNTIEKIAFEKSGIIKENCPVVFDKNNFGASVFNKISKDKKSPVFNPKEYSVSYDDVKNVINYGTKQYELNLKGINQGQNCALALCTINVLQEKGINIEEKNIIKALKNVRWAGRFEYIKKKNIILDGCHNPDGARALRENLDFYFPKVPRTYIYTSLKNKDYKTVQKNLFRKNDKIYHFNMEEENFTDLADIDNSAESIGIEELEEIINSKERKEMLIICGSLYALGYILGKIELCNS